MISELLGIESDYILIGLAALCLILLILAIVNMVQMSKLKKKYKAFMSGKSARSLEDTLIRRLRQMDQLLDANAANERDIRNLFAHVKCSFQKIGLVKYDAFNEMGGKLSFSLALLDESNNGFVMNAVHSREGCYTYVKEVVDGNTVIALADEEKEALQMAMRSGAGDSK